MGNKGSQLNVALVAGPVGKAGVEITTNFIMLFRALCDHLFVITGNFPEDRFSDDKIHILNIRSSKEEEQPFWLWLIGFVLRQVRISLRLITVSRRIDTVVFTIGTELTLPRIVAKMLRKQTVGVTTGSLSEIVKITHGQRSLSYYISTVIEGINYTLSDRISCYSDSLIEQLGLGRYKSKIFPGARFVDTNLFQPNKKLKERKSIIGYAGKLFPPKGVMNFVQAIPIISSEHEDVEFLICGDGSLFDEIKNEIQRNRQETKVTLTGWIPHHKLPDYFNEMKLLVFPSYTEGLPNIVLEAMACGTPVLSTPVGSVPDLIKDGETGFILEENTGRGIAQSVSRALKHPNLGKIADNARNLIEAKYTFEAAVERYRAILYD